MSNIPQYGIYIQGLHYANNRNDCEATEKVFGHHPIEKFYRQVRRALNIKLPTKEDEIHIYRNGKEVLIYAVNGNGDLEVSIQIKGEWVNLLRSVFIKKHLTRKVREERASEKDVAVHK